ncbi:MAG: glycosyltransferase family 39 protein, partial [Deltaproteobacteria bacterium]|nr:glycosyltransferase family 39 protein [Deltaproteobacteria bacterium]
MNIQRFNKSSVHITILVLVVLVFYAHTFDAGFVFDDYAQQEMLKLIKNDQREMNMFYFTSTPEEVDSYIQMTAIPWWTSPKWRLKYLRPVATLSHLIDYSLWGSNPLPYHINNVIWYALLVILLYLLYRSFANNSAMAFCGAMIFALEPCHYFTVRWPASRNDIICATFLVASFIFYLKFCKKRKPLYSMLFIVSYLLALLSKELAFLFPVLIFAYDWIRYKGFKETIVHQWKVYLSLIIINSIHFVFYKSYDYGSYWYGETSLKDYLIEFVKATSLYLNSLFYGGTIAGLGPDVLYKYWLIVVIFLLILFYMLYLIWKERRRYPEINLFMLWIFLLMPFIVVPPINERLLLIPSIGYAYLAALVIFKLGRKRLAIFFIVTGLLLPPVTNIIQARGYDEALQSNYEHLYNALDEIAVNKSSRDRLFIINFPKLGLSGENYMYLALYFTLYYQYPQWKIPVYTLSAFDDRVEVKVLDDQRIKISHPTR